MADTSTTHGLRVGQRVLQIRWRRAIPYLAFGTVTKTTARTYSVDGRREDGWHASRAAAFEAEYKDLFTHWNPFSRDKPHYSVADSVRLITRLRRLETKILLRGQPKATRRKQ